MQETSEGHRSRVSNSNKLTCKETSNEGQIGSSTGIELKTTVKGDIPDTSNGENTFDTNGRGSQKEESFEPKKDLHTTFEKWKILVSKKSLLEEEDHFLRVFLLVFNIGTPALHKTFAEHFSKIKLEGMDRTATLQEIFNDYYKLLDDLNRKRQITDSNWDLLRSPDRVNNSELYDIKLMAVLLTTFESEKIITLKETTKKAIKDIHTQRNEIVHKVTPRISNKGFNTIWNTISKAIKELGGSSYEQECNTLMNATLDSSNTIINQSIKDILSLIGDLQSEYCQGTESKDSPTEGNNEDSISPTEKDNFVRLCALLIQIAPIAVRFCFTRLFPKGLSEMLKRLQGVNADINLECSRGHSGIVDEDDVINYPLPVMLFLLKHYWEFQILDELPDPSETSTDADLTRINHYTLLISDYKTSGSLTTTNFNNIWDIVAEAISRLGDVHMKDRCECLKKADINDTHAEIMIGLVEVQKKLRTLQNHKDRLTETLEELRDPLYKIIQGKTREVEEWVVEDKLFVETRSSAELLKCSRDDHIKSITVVGNLGVGKTFTTRHVSLILRHAEYRILPVSTVVEIKELDDVEIPTLFIVDDFCGNISFSVEQRTGDIKKWRKMSEVDLGSKSKIIVCCTSTVYQHHSFKSLSYFRSCVIDMNSSHLALNNCELRLIAKIHSNIDDRLITKYSREYPFFPLLCKQCSILSKKETKVSPFLCHESIFKNAKVVYESELMFFQRHDKAKYTALALIVKLDNYFKEGYLKESNKDYISVLHKISMILDACKFDHSNALSDIEEELNSMIGSYIIVSTDSQNNLVYSAKTEDLFGVLVAYFKNELPEYFCGSFRSNKNYSKLCSFLTGVHRKANRLAPLFLPCLMFAIGMSVLIYVTVIL